jgi:NADH:ubiquinone oxidoreductase subunit H
MAHGVKRARRAGSREFFRDSGRLLLCQRVRKAVSLSLIIFGWGCQPASGPALVQVNGVLSDRLREGDVIELRGDSFPEGRTAEVTLRGEVSRAGQPRARHFELSLPGRSVSTHAVAVDVTRPVERTLTGTSPALHATFHGSIEVSFAPRVARTPPVAGVLPDVTLDFIPAEGDSASLEAEREEGRRFAEFAGVLLADDPNVPTVSGVMPASAAERAGVVAGDRLLELGGVRVLGIGDFVPPPRARSAELVVQRDGSVDGRRLVLDVTGFRSVAARDLGLAAGLVAGALALLLLLASPFGRALAFVEHRLLERLRSQKLAVPPLRTGAPRRPVSLLGRLSRALPSGPGTYVVFALASALVAAAALGIPLVAREVDLPALVVLAFTALAVASVVFGAPGERGLVARARRALLVFAQSVPALGALGAVGLTVGSFGPEALGLAQGAFPWQWLAFKSPLLLASSLLFVLSLVPEASRGRSLETALGSKRLPTPRAAATALTGQAQLLLGSGVAALAFFGGPHLPGVGVSLVPGFGVALAGVALALLKTWTVSGSVALLRWVLGRIDIDEVRGLTLRAGVPLGAALVGCALLARTAPLEHLLAVSDRGLGWASVAAGVFLCAFLARRLVPRRAVADGERGPNPWL